MRKILFLLILFSTGLASYAQKIDITGTITDAEYGEPLPGVNVAVEGTSLGTITDFDGKYRLTIDNKESVLVFSFIGYKNQKIKVGDKTVINVVLQTSSEELDEVVVVGYGTAKKSDLSGATVSVSNEALEKSVSPNLDQALQGRAAGVTAVVTSGQPGSAATISIRGQGTLSAGSAEPLYIVDGVPIQNVSQSGHDIGLGDRLGNGSVQTFSGLSSINPADILSMEILKDASATAIYGSRGANGVVLITTKRGKTGEAKFTYDFYYGSQEQVKRIDVMNLREYAEYNVDYASETAGRTASTELLDPSFLGEGTNWQDAVFRKAAMQSHQISAAGGTEKVKYFISGSYFDQEGTMVGSDFERFSGRVNLDADLKDWFKLGTNISLSRSSEHIGLTNSIDGIISVALLSSPDIPIYNTDGTWSGDAREGSAGRVNPIAQAYNLENKLKRNNLNANFFADIKIVDGLTLRSELGLDLSGSNAYTFTPTYTYGSVSNTVNSSARQYNQNTFWQVKNYLTYAKSFGLHNVTLMVGQEASEYKYENLRGSSSGLSSNDIHEPDLGDETTMSVGSATGSGSMASVYGRANYDYNNKYYVTYTYRYDGSSNFGPENRWAPFHAVATSWRINKESFMESVGQISNLKLRIGWGQTGNAQIDGYLWGASIAKMPTGLGTGLRQSNIANPYIQWEKQIQSNLGIDLGLFDERISMTVDMYLKKSSEMLMDMQLPSYMGTSGNPSIALAAPMGNFGEIENKGIEISVTGKPFVGAFNWETSLQVTINKNKLLGLTGTPAAHIEGVGQWTDLVSLTEIGDPLYNFYGYKVDGVYQDLADIENSPKPKAYPEDGNFNRANTVWPGDLKFKDLSGPDGKPDGVVDDYDRTNIGSPLPKFTYGFNNSFSYKGFELSVFVMGSYGNKVLNYIGRSLSNMESMWDNQLRSVVDRAKLEPINTSTVYPFVDANNNTVTAWFNDVTNVRVANSGTSMPRAIASDPNDNIRISDRYIEDGSYLRIKNVSLAYYIPKTYLDKVKISSLKIYMSIQNLHTFTNYSGFDPEIGASQTNDYVRGLDNGRYPAPRIYTFGATISL